MSEQYLGNMVFDITRTLKDYDYTKNSVINFNRIISSREFEDMPSETIFRYLRDQMEIVSFGDYLRRYIYDGSDMKQPFAELGEEFYVSVISDSFAMNRAPHAFRPVKTRWSNIIKRWLRSNSAERDTVFLLGFGLNMSDRDVSEFLMKVIKEQDFRFDDPRETVFWFCYHHGYPYSTALELLEDYHAADQKGEDVNPEFWESVKGSLTVYLSNPEKLKEYLGYLKLRGEQDKDIVFHEFENIYTRAVSAARSVAGRGEAPQKERELSGAFDIESLLYSGIPRTGNKNLTAADRSTLAAHFQKKRISRQRLSRLLRRETEADRFDLMTLLFLVYAITVEPEWPNFRYMTFIDEVNEILLKCHMLGIYPVNPYESFVLMCLLTEDPLAVYNDVWEISYQQQDE